MSERPSSVAVIQTAGSSRAMCGNSMSRTRAAWVGSQECSTSCSVQYWNPPATGSGSFQSEPCSHIVPISVRNSQIQRLRAVCWAGSRDQTLVATAMLPIKDAA